MPNDHTRRQVAHLAADLETLRADCGRLGDTFRGVALLFSVAAALTFVGGLWTAEPLFTISFGFALTAAIAFAFGARGMRQAANAAPRIVAEPAGERRPAPSRWSQAA